MISIQEKDITKFCIKRLSEIYGKKVELLNTEYVGGGCINQTLVLSFDVGKFFLKWNSSCDDDMFFKEARGLEEMYSVNNPYLKIPKVICTKEVSKKPGALVLEYLEPATNTEGMDEKLGRGLAFMHQKTADKFGFYHDNYCGSTVQNNKWNSDWIDFFGHQRLWYLLELIQKSRSISSEELSIYESLIRKLPEFLPANAKPVLIHGDLWSGNYLYTKGGPALIDPAAYYAHNEMEMAIMTMFGGFSPAVWNAYQEVLPLEAGWEERNKIYQLYHVLNHYYLFGGSYRNQAFAIASRFV